MTNKPDHPTPKASERQSMPNEIFAWSDADGTHWAPIHTLFGNNKQRMTKYTRADQSFEALLERLPRGTAFDLCHLETDGDWHAQYYHADTGFEIATGEGNTPAEAIRAALKGDEDE